MATKILAPHFLRIEREIRAPLSDVWQALTDVFELRAWWGVPVVELKPDVGGFMEVRKVSESVGDVLSFSIWDNQWRIGGKWMLNSGGSYHELVCVVEIAGGVRVSVEHSELDTPAGQQVRLFGALKSNARQRLERLQRWCEQHIPANLAR